MHTSTIRRIQAGAIQKLIPGEDEIRTIPTTFSERPSTSANYGFLAFVFFGEAFVLAGFAAGFAAGFEALLCAFPGSAFPGAAG